MPALVLFGRRWHVAADDLPFPCLLGAVYHAVWAAFLVLVLSLVQSPNAFDHRHHQKQVDQPPTPGGSIAQELVGHPLPLNTNFAYSSSSCDEVDSGYRTFLSSLLGCYVALVLVLLGFAWTSSQGAILEVDKRQWVPVWAYLTVLLYLTQAVTAGYGTAVVHRDGVGVCIRYTDNARRDRVATVALVSAVWVGFAAWLGALVLFFNIFPSPLGEDVSGSNSRADALLASWERRCHCLRYMLCCVWKLTHLGSHSHLPPSTASYKLLQDSNVVLDTDIHSSTPAQAQPGDTSGLAAQDDNGHAAAMYSPPTAATMGIESPAGPGSHTPAGLSPRAGDGRGAQDAPGTPKAAQAVPKPPMHVDPNPFRTLAKIFSHFFGYMDLTLSDMVTALMLVGIRQRLLREEAGARTAGQAADLHMHSQDEQSQPVETLEARPVELQDLEEVYHYFRLACGSYGWPLWLWANLTTRKWHRSINLLPSCFRRRRRRHAATGSDAAAALLPAGSTSLPAQSAPAPAGTHLQAIVNWTGLPPEAVLHLSTELTLAGQLPFFVAVDEARNEVIVSIRGSMSMTDVATDMLCHPVPLPTPYLDGLCMDSEPPQRPVFVHGGILSSTEAMLRALDALQLLPALLNPANPADSTAPAAPVPSGVGGVERATSRSLRQRGSQAAHTVQAADAAATHSSAMDAVPAAEAHFISFDAPADDMHLQASAMVSGSSGGAAGGSSTVKQRRLVIVGHSLGAAVAALLSLRMRRQYPSLRCWCYSPPGGLLSAHAGPLMCGWVRSVVIGRDMIPRLSTRAMQQLCHDMLDAAARCRVSKLGLWWRTGVRGHKWRRTELFREDAEVPRAVQAFVSEAKHAMEMSPHAAWLADAADFGLPGQILYFEQVEENPQGLGANARHTLDMLASADAAASPTHIHRPSGSGAGLAGKASYTSQPVFVPRAATATEFQQQGMLVTRSMFAAHVPDFQIKVVKQALKRARMEEGLVRQQAALHAGAEAV